MTKDEANELRCIACEIIIKLMDAGEKGQLQLIEDHARAARQKLDKAHETKKDPYGKSEP